MKKINIKAQVKELQLMADNVTNMSYNDPEQKVEDEKFWMKLEELNKEAIATGQLVGRHVSFAVADGAAHYIVVKVGKVFTQVEQLPIYDNWHYNGVYQGKIQTGIIKHRLNSDEAMKKLFSSID